MIHATAVVHPRAEVPTSVTIGPYAVIDEDVILGADCVVGPHVHLSGAAVIGERNRFYTGCVIGGDPQDLKYKGERTRLRIGSQNVFRENVTVNRSSTPEAETVIGSNGFYMAGSHMGHNCVVGDHVIMANGALLGGHAQVAARAFISGNCLVHQFVRVGTMALMQGGAAISKDLPPYCIARGDNGICGLNVVGLRRAGMSSEERLELKRAYHLLFRSHRPFRQALDEARQTFTGNAARGLLDFIGTTRRGICADTSWTRGDAQEEK